MCPDTTNHLPKRAAMTTIEPEDVLAEVNFPRTGKRGVPQQFPRRLFEMLESETRSAELSDDYHKVIGWSESGKAFRIYDAAEFSNVVLPKYFRTKKFSSFQRNLNLYGFAKVRRGPESDMYAHPSFVRTKPAQLLQLRKMVAGRGNGTTSHDFLLASLSPPSSPSRPLLNIVKPENARAVSPTGSSSVETTSSGPNSPVAIAQMPWAIPAYTWDAATTPRASVATRTVSLSLTDPPSPRQHTASDRGKLDLLALALEQGL